MYNMGQKLEQVFITGGGCRQSLMADRVITSTLQSLARRNAIFGEERP